MTWRTWDQPRRPRAAPSQVAAVGAATPPVPKKPATSDTTCTKPAGEDQAGECGGQLELVRQETRETVLYTRETLTTRIDVLVTVRCKVCGATEMRELERGRVPTEPDTVRSW